MPGEDCMLFILDIGVFLSWRNSAPGKSCICLSVIPLVHIEPEDEGIHRALISLTCAVITCLDRLEMYTKCLPVNSLLPDTYVAHECGATTASNPVV